MEIIKGKNILKLETYNNQYHQQDKINVFMDNGDVYKIDIKEFEKVLNQITFKATLKRKYKHLEIIKIGEVD